MTDHTDPPNQEAVICATSVMTEFAAHAIEHHDANPEQAAMFMVSGALEFLAMQNQKIDESADFLVSCVRLRAAVLHEASERSSGERKGLVALMADVIAQGVELSKARAARVEKLVEQDEEIDRRASHAVVGRA